MSKVWRIIGILCNGLKFDMLVVFCSVVLEYVMMEEGYVFSLCILVFIFYVLFVYWVRFLWVFMSV